MSPEELDQELTALLRSEAAAVPDAGFSDRVIGALPRRRTQPWLRPAILVGMTFCGALLGLVLLPGGEFLQQTLAQLFHTKLLLALPVPWLLLVYLLSWVAVTSGLEQTTDKESNANALS